MTVRVLEKADLEALEPLLRASYGADDFSLGDELEAFDELKPEDWFVRADPEPQGFICYFPLAEGLFIGELYATPGAERMTREKLLKHFLAHHRLPQTARLRLGVRLSDPLNHVLSQVPRATGKTFAYYRAETPAQLRTHAEETVPFSRRDLEEVQNVLGVLKRYSSADLERLDRAGSLLAVRDGRVRAALHVENRGAAGLEVVTLATYPAARRRGHASALLQTLFRERPGVTVFLKVETANGAATGLYERTGFVRDEHKTERRWYLPLEPLS